MNILFNSAWIAVSRIEPAVLPCRQEFEARMLSLVRMGNGLN